MGVDLTIRPRPGADPPPVRHLSRNWGGIGEVVRAMAQLGMAFPSQAPQLPGPEPEPWEEHFTPACEPRTEIGHAYWLRQQRALRDHGGPDEQPGIPIHKFASNDGWQVTAQECRQAVAAHEAAMAAGLPHPPALREDVLPFLRAAAQADGFEVY